MDNQTYLNSISTGTPPSDADSTSQLQSILPKIFFGFLGFIVIAVIGILVYSAAAPTNPQVTLASELKRIYLRSNSLNSLISSYSPKVGTSNLRSTSNSLSNVLSTISSTTSYALANSYGVTLDSKTTPSASDQALINASIKKLKTKLNNGLSIDITYATELSSQLNLLIALLDSALTKIPETDRLHASLTSSRSSLDNLHKVFASYANSST